MQNEVNVTITQDKLVDILMHAATREDISNLRDKMDKDISSLRSEVKSDISSLRSEVKSDIDSVRAEIKDVRSEVKDLRKEMNTKFTWLYGLVVVSILIPLVSRFIPQLS